MGKNSSMEGKQRFLFVDGLRGVAALAVLLHHAACRTICQPIIERRLPALVWGVLFNLNTGVEIFFVISGFVIAHSLRESTFTPGEVRRFIVRRQSRLDPPYWVVVAFVLLCTLIGARVGILDKGAGSLTIGSVLANLFYLQGLLDKPAVLPVAWTLCIEVQFYLAFVLLMALGRLRGPRGVGGPSPLAQGLLFVTASASLFANPDVIRGATLAPYWGHFAAGVLCYWVYRRQVAVGLLAMLVAGFAASIVVWHFPVSLCVGLATIVALHAVGRADALERALSNRPIQYFGAVSYSLYLVHVTVLGIVTRGGSMLLHGSDARSVLLVVIGVVVSVGVAHLLHIVVERPSMRFAQTFRRPRATIPLPNDAARVVVAA